MTLVFDAGRQTSHPQTHALVIGVGEYPHLLGGQLPGTVTMGLGQLTSSVVSAEAFANWLIASLQNPAVPLGTVELLLSPGFFKPAGGGPAVPVDRATLANIKASFNAWYDRCHASEYNIAMFFFSGHGLEKEKQILLAEDFADPKSKNLWDHAIDFNDSWWGMAECAAHTQCYFLDACRETPIDLLKTSSANAQVLKTTQLNSFADRDAYVLKGAAPGRKAHGPVGGQSYFTQALIRCLTDSGAAYWNGNVWKVTTGSLIEAVPRLMRRLEVPGGVKLTCTRGGESAFTSEIHEVAGPVQVMAQVSCDPFVALAQATLSVASAPAPPFSRPPHPDPWDLAVPNGSYDVGAAFSGAPYNDRTLPGILFVPPFTPVVVKL